MFLRFLLTTAGSTEIQSAQNPMIVQKRLIENIAYSVARKREITAVQERAISICCLTIDSRIARSIPKNVGMMPGRKTVP
jgi:hypothetical protein